MSVDPVDASVADVNNGDLDDSATTPNPDPISEPPGHDPARGAGRPLDVDSEGESAEAAPPGLTSDEVEQSELDLGVISTGTVVVDHALAPLEGLGALPVADHPEVFERVLGDLSATMAEGVADEGSPRDA